MEEDIGQNSLTNGQEQPAHWRDRLSRKIGETKEAAMDFVRYKQLKVKEYFGKIDKHEFNELLEMDFQQELEDNSPIEGVFSPEDDLVKVRQLPKAEKSEALDGYKSKLARQREAWASCQVFIERCIEFDHNYPVIKLRGWVDTFGQRYGFTEEQMKKANNLIDEFVQSRDNALIMREKYPNNIDLINELTGIRFDPKTNVDVSVGPMSIDIDADGESAVKIFEKFSNIVVRIASSGFMVQSFHYNNPVYYTVVNRRMQALEGVSKKRIRVHEYEHIKQRWFRKVFGHLSKDDQADRLLSSYKTEAEIQSKKKFLQMYFRVKMENAYAQTAEEFLSIKREPGISVPEMSYRSFFKKNHSDRDYLAKVRNPEGHDIEETELWKQTSKAILEDEYERKSRTAFKAFSRLKKEGGFSKSETIAMFTDKPLTKWPKVTKRMLEYKEKKLA